MDAQSIADRFEIEDLLQRYTTAIDTRDWALLDTVFTPDAHLDYTASGGARGAYPEVRAWLAKTLAAFSMSQHMIGKSSYEFGTDEVRCRTIFHNPMGLPTGADGSYDAEGSGMAVFVVGGWYNDRCVRTPDGWRIAEKTEDQGYFEGTIAPGSTG
jgi:hypothetical protein